MDIKDALETKINELKQKPHSGGVSVSRSLLPNVKEGETVCFTVQAADENEVHLTVNSSASS